MLADGVGDKRAWLTLVLTTRCLAGAFSLAYGLAALYTREFESQLVLIVGLSVVWGGIPLFFARRLVRQYRLTRLGDSTMARIEQRVQPSKDPVNARLQFHFEANGGRYSGWGRDEGYHVAAGSLVPIFFEAKNPKTRLLASESYFEVVEDETNS